MILDSVKIVFKHLKHNLNNEYSGKLSLNKSKNVIKYLWFYICVTFPEKAFRQNLTKNVAGVPWDPAETIRTVRRIKPALISSGSDLYNVLKYLVRCKRTELNI